MRLILAIALYVAKLETVDCDYVFIPSVAEMYPSDHATFVDVNTADSCEASIRPGHFRGVATIVTKLFNIVQPSFAFFGQKDAMQCIVIKRLVRDLSIPVEIVVHPTLREQDGLAMSSRNVYLSAEDRKKAPILYKALLQASKMFYQGERRIETIKTEVIRVLNSADVDIQYVSVADAATGKEFVKSASSVESQSEIWPKEAILSLAVKLGSTRLIDNISLVSVPDS